MINYPLGGWFFHVGGAEPAFLFGRQEKAAYGYYLLAIAAYLSNDERSAHRHLREVRQLRVPSSQTVETIVWADLQRLRQTRKETRARVGRLERMIWPNGFPWPSP
jgi:uncharacterized membrane protein